MENQKPVLKLVRKSNELVEAKYKFDIWETRVFTKMLTLIKKDDDDFKDYRIYIKDVISEFGLENQNASYERIKEGALKLMNKTVKILRNTDEGVKEFHANIVAGIEMLENSEEAKYIDISFHPKMKPSLLQLKSQFTTYDVRNVLNLPSTYSIRIYELLKQYEKIGKRKISIEELKEIVGVIEEVKRGTKTEHKDRYPLYGNFRQRVLLQAQKDLSNNTDISFTFEPVKVGRKYTKIIFYITPNRPRRNNKPTKEQSKHIYDIIEPFTKTWKQGITREVVSNLIKKGASDENLKQSVVYTNNRIESGKPIESEVAYFVKMANEAMKQGNLFDPIEEKKEEIKSKKKKLVEIEKSKDILKTRLEALEKERKIILEKAWNSVDRESKLRVLEKIRKKKNNLRKYKGDDDMLNSKMIQAFMIGEYQDEENTEFLKLKPVYEKIRILNKEIQGL